MGIAQETAVSSTVAKDDCEAGKVTERLEKHQVDTDICPHIYPFL